MHSFTLKKIKLPCYIHDTATLSNSHLITFDQFSLLNRSGYQTHFTQFDTLVQKTSSAFICLRLCVCTTPIPKSCNINI